MANNDSAHGREALRPTATQKDEINALRDLAARARRLADGAPDQITRDRLVAAAAEYEQRAKEADIDDPTGQ